MPCACALLLTGAMAPAGAARPLARLRLELDARGTPDPLPAALDPALETLRAGNPAARALPLLRCIAAGATGVIRLPYLDDLDLLVRVD